MINTGHSECYNLRCRIGGRGLGWKASQHRPKMNPSLSGNMLTVSKIGTGCRSTIFKIYVWDSLVEFRSHFQWPFVLEKLLNEYFCKP